MGLQTTFKGEFLAALEKHGPDYGLKMSAEILHELGVYFETLSVWNARLHLVAPCSPAEFATRHVLESLTAIQFMPPAATVFDIGSGGGLPIVPCLIARSDITANLIEASTKKAVFLRECLRTLNLGLRATVTATRFQELKQPAAVCITCRAIEHFTSILGNLVAWAGSVPRLLLFGSNSNESTAGTNSLGAEIARLGLEYESIRMPNSENRYLFVIDQLPIRIRESAT